VAEVRVGDDVGERAEVELAARIQPASEDRQHRVHEEHPEEGEGNERERDPRGAGQPSTVVRHWSIQSSR
jgi:hypothetical protein